jgi:hypothetical protein
MGTGVKRPRLKRGHLHPYSAEVENAWSFPSTFIACKSTTLLHLNRAYFSQQGPLRANEYVKLTILEAGSKMPQDIVILFKKAENGTPKQRL